MSAVVQVKLKQQLTRLDMIERALLLMKVPSDCIVKDACPQVYNQGTLRAAGVSGSVPLCVRKKLHGGFGDLFFANDEAGSYRVFMDDLDQSTLERALGLPADSFTDMLSSYYAAACAEYSLLCDGYQVDVVRDGEQLHVTAYAF